MLDRLAGLPPRQAEALRGAFGLADDPAPADALLTGIAVLTLLSALSDEQPLLVAVDDAQLLDRASLDTVAFAARRLETEQLVLLAGARGNGSRRFPAGTSRTAAATADPAGRRTAPGRTTQPPAAGPANRSSPKRPATHWR